MTALKAEERIVINIKAGEKFIHVRTGKEFTLHRVTRDWISWKVPPYKSGTGKNTLTTARCSHLAFETNLALGLIKHALAHTDLTLNTKG